MKTVFGAMLSLILLPGLALAQDPAPESPPSETPAAAETAPTAETSPTVVADGQKEEKRTTKKEIGAIASAVTPEQMRAFRGFIHTLSLDHSVGTGTMVDPALYSSVTGALGVNSTYAFGLGKTSLNANAGVSFNYEYSLPDNNNGRRFDWSDIRLGLSAPAFIREKFTGINVTPSLGATVPISLGSIHASTITNLSAALGANRMFGSNFMVNARVAGSRGFQFNDANFQSGAGARDAQGNLIYLCRTGEQLCDSAGMNAAWGLSGAVGVAYGVTDKFWAGTSFSLGKTWMHAATDEVDEFTPKARDSNGNLVARAGMGQRDMMSASLWASYALSSVFSADLSMGTMSTPLTSDNKNVRFPLFDFLGPAANRTSFSLGLSARL